jgi:hypothetical protein
MSTSPNLDQLRTAAQGLHAAISDAAAKQDGAAKAEIEAVGQKAKGVRESLKATMSVQDEATKKHLNAAAAALEAMQKHAAEAAKSSGQEFRASIRKILADARASAQKVSEAVAAQRSAQTRKSH